MPTLREYLEKEAQEYGWISQDYHNGSHNHWWFAGHAKAYRRLLEELSDETLDIIKVKEVN